MLQLDWNQRGTVRVCFRIEIYGFLLLSVLYFLVFEKFISSLLVDRGQFLSRSFLDIGVDIPIWGFLGSSDLRGQIGFPFIRTFIFQLLGDFPALHHAQIFKFPLPMEHKCVLGDHDQNVQADIAISSVYHAPPDQVAHIKVSHVFSELIQVVRYEKYKRLVY